MEKNVTPNMQRPSFFKTFLYVFCVFMLLNMIFGKKKEELPTINPMTLTKKVEVKRNLIPFETESLKGNFNSVGLRVDDIILKKYKETLAKDSPNVELLKYVKDEKDDKEKSSYVEFGLLPVSENQNFFPTNMTEWKIVSKSDNKVVLEWTNSKKIKFTRELSFDENYMLTVKDTVKNNSNKDVEFYPYARVVKSQDMYAPVSSSHTGFVAYLNGTLEEYRYGKIADKKLYEFNSKDGWLGFGSDYFMSILVPDENNQSFTARVLELSDVSMPKTSQIRYKQYQADYVRDVISVAPNKSETVVSRVYIGAKESSVIAKYEKEFSIPKFDLVIDYGYFYILSKPFTKILKWFYDFTGNFGVAIILFTILIRALLFPIAQKSFKSMEKMKKMQPEMKRIQAMYAGNKQMMNMQLAMLYKKHGINPLSGCLPMLVQIPVFFALYKSLVISIEMRQAPFIWWIKDLSAPDPTSVFNLFGLLPFTPYSWLPHLGVLPLLMGLTMYIQQKMQPMVSTDATQAKMMKFLPFIFILMFGGLPSGLVLYWTVNNILSIIQQKYIK
ncbi:MAG: membrane protein insertase YidC [Alphaproteobacteria bacterium]|nr:membrane protein insertase YidC [Alphaproteobacteria bacterium]